MNKRKMDNKKIDEYICNCPYFSGKNTIDRSEIGTHVGSCDLEYHYQYICPSSKCICAEILGFIGVNDGNAF